MPFQLTPSGLETESQQEIRQRIVEKLQAAYGPNINTQTGSAFGNLTDILSEQIALTQQTCLAVYSSFDPDNATGTALDARAALTGSTRDGATFSEVDGLIEFSGPATVNDGDIIQNDDNQSQWQAVNGPYTDTGGPYPEQVPATFVALESGPVIANAGTPWSPITIIPNVAGFTNPTDDANVGQNQQTDPQFRASRQVELYSQGDGPLAAITAVVSKVPGVLTARTYHNPDQAPADADGIPFKAFNVVVETSPSSPTPSLQQAIGDAIWSAMGAGGEAYGTDFSVTVVDEEGLPQPVSFDVVDLVDVFITIDISTAGTEQPVSENLADVVAEYVLQQAQANFSGLGQNQINFEYAGLVYDLQAAGQISGVTDVTVTLSDGGLPANPLPISIRERPEFDSANITVNVTP